MGVPPALRTRGPSLLNRTNSRGSAASVFLFVRGGLTLRVATPFLSRRSGAKRPCTPPLRRTALVRGCACDGESDDMIAMPEPDQEVLARRAEIVAALRRIVPWRGRDRQGRRTARLRMRWAHRLSPAADGRRAARHDRTGRGGFALLCGERRQSRAAGRRNLAVGRRIAARRRRLAWHGQVQPHPRD